MDRYVHLYPLHPILQLVEIIFTSSLGSKSRAFMIVTVRVHVRGRTNKRDCN